MRLSIKWDSLTGYPKTSNSVLMSFGSCSWTFELITAVSEYNQNWVGKAICTCFMLSNRLSTNIQDGCKTPFRVVILQGVAINFVLDS